MSKTIVMKFGGSSVADAEAIRQAAARVIETVAAGHHVVVVVSAMRGVTDLLIGAAQRAAAGDATVAQATKQRLWERHHAAAVALLPEPSWSVLGPVEAELSNFGNLTSAIAVLGELTPRALDLIASLGERFSAILVAAYLRSQQWHAEAIMADSLIVTDGQFGNANPLLAATTDKVQAALQPLLADGVVPVVTGFMGATEEGVVTTLGRGGSDFTAAILGYGLDADEIWIWSDVDGVLTADPRTVADAHPIRQLSYREAAELAHFGAKVLHPKTVRPAVEKRIPIRMLNTFNPSYGGTWITHEAVSRHDVTGVTAIPNVAQVTVEGRGMLGVPGVAARVFGAVATLGTSVLMISQGSSEQSICFVVREEEAEAVRRALCDSFEREMARGIIERIFVEDDVVIIAVVGAAMRHTPGIAGRLFTALGKEQINVISIAQGSSEYNLSLVVSAAEADGAVRAIHDAFHLERKNREGT